MSYEAFFDEWVQSMVFHYRHSTSSYGYCMTKWRRTKYRLEAEYRQLKRMLRR